MSEYTTKTGQRLIVLDDIQIRQRHVEEFYKRVRELQGGDVRISSPEFVGVVVRASSTAGIIGGIDEDGIGELTPADVIRLSELVQNTLTEASGVTKN